VLELNLQATRGLLPDKTILLLIDPVEAAERGGQEDRIEREGGEFRRKVDAAYRELAALFPRRIVPADATQPPESLSRLIRGQLRQLS
jgi:thymidylate kinase